MQENEKVYFENLDGLRFVCFLSVFLFHSFHTNFDNLKNSWGYEFIKKHVVANGNLGVNFFFVLSGFLITYLLLKEKKLLARIDITSFWKRRIFRIWPLYFFCVFFGFVIFPICKKLFGQTPNETADVFYYLTFLNNFDFIRKGLPDASVLGVLWSIAIEEQFYFVWPIILAILPEKFYLHFFIAIIVASVAFRFVWTDYLFSEYHTLSCMGDLAIGALGALLVQQSSVVAQLQRTPRIVIGFLYVLIVFVFFFRNLMVDWLGSFERAVIGFLFLFVILEQTYSQRSFYKMKNFKVFSSLGVITYGLYCLHFIGILIVTTLTSLLHWNTHLWQVMILETTGALVASVVIAKLSYNYYERPFLLMGKRFSHINTDRS